MRTSEFLRIEDDVAAFDFDLAATSRLLFFDLEKEKRTAQSDAIDQAMSALVPTGFDTSKSEQW